MKQFLFIITSFAINSTLLQAKTCTDVEKRKVASESMVVLNDIRRNYRDRNVEAEIQKFQSYVSICDGSLSSYGFGEGIYDYWRSKEPSNPIIGPPFDVPPATDEDLKFDDIKIVDEFSDSLSIYPIAKENEKANDWLKTEQMNYFNGIEIPDTVTSLPEPAVFVGDRKCHFTIPIQGDPTESIEDGDILIYFQPHVDVEAKSLYRNVVRGMSHLAVAMTDKDGKMLHVDSPHGWTGSKFGNDNFHIIRLRKFPEEIRSNSDLERWLKSPEKREILKDFLTERRRKLAMIRYYTSKLLDQGYSYDGGHVNEIDYSPNEMREKLELGVDTSLSLYCSELALTTYSLAGVEKPAQRGISEVIQALDHYFDNTKTYERLSREEAVKKGLLEMPIEYNGSDNIFLNSLMRLLFSPKKLKDLKGANKEIQNLLASSREEAISNIASLPWSVRKYVSGEVIGPADYFESILQPDSDYSYAGTHLVNYESSRRPTQRGVIKRTLNRRIIDQTDRSEICKPISEPGASSSSDTRKGRRDKQRSHRETKDVYQGD